MLSKLLLEKLNRDDLLAIARLELQVAKILAARLTPSTTDDWLLEKIESLIPECHPDGVPIKATLLNACGRSDSLATAAQADITTFSPGKLIALLDLIKKFMDAFA